MVDVTLKKVLLDYLTEVNSDDTLALTTLNAGGITYKETNALQLIAYYQSDPNHGLSEEVVRYIHEYLKYFQTNEAFLLRLQTTSLKQLDELDIRSTADELYIYNGSVDIAYNWIASNSKKAAKPSLIPGICIGDMIILRIQDSLLAKNDSSLTHEELSNIEEYIAELVNDPLLVSTLKQLDQTVLEQYGITNTATQILEKHRAQLRDYRESLLHEKDTFRDKIIHAETAIDDNGISYRELNVLRLIQYYQSHPEDHGLSSGTIHYIQKGLEYFQTEKDSFLLRLKNTTSINLDELDIRNITDELYIYNSSAGMACDWLIENSKKAQEPSSIPGLSIQDLIIFKISEDLLTTDNSDFDKSMITNYIDELANDPSMIIKLRKLDQVTLQKYGITKTVNNILEDKLSRLAKKVDLIAQEIDNINNNPLYGKELTEYGLSQHELTAIKLLSLVSPKNSDSKELAKLLPPKYVDFLNTFVVNSMGDMNFNKRLGSLIYNQEKVDAIRINEGTGVYTAAKDLQYFTFKTRKSKKYGKIADRFAKNASSSRIIPKRKKLSLGEYAVISDIDKVRNLLPEQIYLQNDKLRNFFSRAKRIHPALKKLKSSFHIGLAKDHSVISTMNMSKYSKLRRVGMSFMQILRRIITKHDHTSIIYRKHENEALTQSHLNAGVGENSFSYDEYLYSDLYKIKIDVLIDKKYHSVLEDNLGVNWKEKISKRFGEIERNLHDQATYKFSGIQTPTASGFRTRGLLSLFKFKKFEKTNFKSVLERVESDQYTYTEEHPEMSTMMCSEFAARTIIASIAKLNHALKEELGASGRVVRMPFGKNEDLTVMTPDRLIIQLKHYKCLEKVRPHQEISKHLRI